MKNFRDLKVWQKAHDFSVAVYRETETFPRSEIYGLTSQIRRAAVSIPSNIAEGCDRDGDPEFVRFLRIAMGSANEVDYQLLLARDLAYLHDDHYQELNRRIQEVKKMLTALIRTIQTVD